MPAVDLPVLEVEGEPDPYRYQFGHFAIARMIFSMTDGLFDLMGGRTNEISWDKVTELVRMDAQLHSRARPEPSYTFAPAHPLSIEGWEAYWLQLPPPSGVTESCGVVVARRPDLPMVPRVFAVEASGGAPVLAEWRYDGHVRYERFEPSEQGLTAYVARILADSEHPPKRTGAPILRAPPAPDPAWWTEQPAPEGSSPTDASDPTRAASLMAEGVQLLQGGRETEAVEKLEASLALHSAPGTARLLVAVHLRRGNRQRALQVAQEHGVDLGPPEGREVERPDPIATVRSLTTIADFESRISEGKEAGGTVALQEPSLEFDYVNARGALLGDDDDELSHGFWHLAEVVAADPGRRETMELVDAYLDRKPGEELLPPLDPQNAYYAHEAMRALVWHRDGDTARALMHLAAVQRAKRDAGYLEAWGPDWLGDGLDLESVPALMLLTDVFSSLSEAHDVPVHRLEPARRWARLSRAILARDDVPEELSGQAVQVVLALHRKAGLLEEGLAIAEEHLAEKRTVFVLHGRALLRNAMGDAEGSIADYDEVVALDPERAPLFLLELADHHLERRNYTEARETYEKVLAGQPGHPWATPSAAYCRFREGHPDALEPTDALMRAWQPFLEAREPRAYMLLRAFRPWEGFVPAASDATANTARKIALDEVKASGTIDLGLSDVESPSGLVALAQILGDGVAVRPTYANVASPDPREPLGPVLYALWRRDGDHLVPARLRSDPEVSRVVTELASAPYERVRTWAAASRVAAALGSEHVESLLACVSRPPPLPAGRDAVEVLTWIPQVQLIVAMILAHLEPEQPWEGSLRRDALRTLLHGPMDWSTSAAIVAMAEVARDDRFALTDVRRTFGQLLAKRPDRGGCPWDEVLLERWSTLPHLPDEERDWLVREPRGEREAREVAASPSPSPSAPSEAAAPAVPEAPTTRPAPADDDGEDLYVAGQGRAAEIVVVAVLAIVLIVGVLAVLFVL